ncbi:MAG: DUF1549 and DUF1553 domain-containing protein [Gemmataceae bacterium]|nr:DUF1549 and DUF1553 domain-containing protein [Gemmataceae bacterium]
MWARHLLFIGLVVGGIAMLRASLFTLPQPPKAAVWDAAANKSNEFQEVVARLDASFQKQWTEQNVMPAPPASDLAVARRVSLALTGTVPSLQEIRQFEALPPQERLDWWVSLLLRDRRFADYFAERLARAYVGTEDGPFIIYRRHRFVAWLSDELMNNTPYGSIVEQLIASEGLWTETPATNFVTVTVTEGEKRGPNPERLAGRVARAFLGIRLDCAQCHDHFLDVRWKQRDFQGLAAFFAQTTLNVSGIRDKDGEFEGENFKTHKKEIIPPAVPFHQELLPTDGSRRSRLARWVTHPENVHFSRATVQRVWALMFGKALGDSVEAMNADGELHPALEILAKDFTQHNYDLKRLIRLIAATRVFRLDSASEHPLTDEHDAAWAVFPMSRLRPEQVAGSILQAAAIETVNDRSNVFVRIARFTGERDFVKRYGDTGEDEFDGRGGTIPQRLLLMNGNLVHDKTKTELANAGMRIAMLAPGDPEAVEAAYLAVLTRRPTPEESKHFIGCLEGLKGKDRHHRLGDICWTLMNATEFSWNH